MRFQAAIFDLDGTLLDTLDDLANAANATLATHGFPTHPRDAYRYFIGDGVHMLVQRALPPEQRDADTLERCLATMRVEYQRHLNVTTRPYPGIPELLEALAGRKLRLAVLSNKPDRFTQECVRHFFGAARFDLAIGQREDLPRKPDPAGARLIAQTWGLDPGSILYLGDTATDMQTARAAGMHAVGVLWGFRTRQELEENGAQQVAAHPADVLGLLT